MLLEKRMGELRDHFGLTPEDLSRSGSTRQIVVGAFPQPVCNVCAWYG